MESWPRSSVTPEILDGLVNLGLLLAKAMVEEWLVPIDHDSPAPPVGYVVSFVPFHERGFVPPPHRFLRG
jgi:hypothetical protein